MAEGWPVAARCLLLHGLALHGMCTAEAVQALHAAWLAGCPVGPACTAHAAAVPLKHARRPASYTLRPAEPKIALLGAMQSLFEASMYTFVFLWTPALRWAGHYGAACTAVKSGSGPAARCRAGLPALEGVLAASSLTCLPPQLSSPPCSPNTERIPFGTICVCCADLAADHSMLPVASPVHAAPTRSASRTA